MPSGGGIHAINRAHGNFKKIMKNSKKIYLALRKRVLLSLRGRFFIVRRQRGLTFLVDVLNYIDRQIEAFGSYENAQINSFVARIGEHDATLFVDIGANLGLYSLAVAKSFPNCDIVAFEPDRRNFCQLHGNLFVNEFEDRVRVEPFALGANSGQTRFIRHSAENRGRSRVDADGSVSVEVRKLDDLLMVSGLRIALKIDVEGHEHNVITGATKLLLENDCLLQIESFSPDRLERQLAALGYRLLARHGDDLTFERHPDLVTCTE